MGQVPGRNPHYLLIGNGRTALQFRYYFQQLQLSFDTFSRSENPVSDLTRFIEAASHILILVKDEAIPIFYEDHPELRNRQCVHFSGTLVHPEIACAHPLMTFSKTLLPLTQLRQISFTIEAEGPAFSELLPGVPNPYVRLPRALKASYHAWCVISGNFTTLLWERTAQEFQRHLGLDPQILVPYLEACTGNIRQHLLADRKSDGESSLTGPFARRDFSTISTHLAALESDPYQQVYQAFWAAYQQQQSSTLKEHA